MQHILNTSALKSLSPDKKVVTLSHGSGGRETNDLINRFIAPAIGIQPSALDDAATLSFDKLRIAFTTDSFVVQPYIFPGGNIGKLSVFGTVNDLSVQGAKPLAISLALIIEESFPLSELEAILCSVSDAAKKSGVKVVTGDTKVVGKGGCDGIYINTSGVGITRKSVCLDISGIEPSDKIIASGDIGVHGIAVMAARYGFETGDDLISDCAPLNKITENLLSEFGAEIKWMRDPTRGGISSVLNELSKCIEYDIQIYEKEIPVNRNTKFIADMLGIDILESASEGIFVAVASKDVASQVVQLIREITKNKQAAIIGEIDNRNEDPVVFLNTKVGGKTVIHMPSGEQLPRIC